MRKSLVLLTVAIATLVAAAVPAGSQIPATPLERRNVDHITNRNEMTGGHVSIQPVRQGLKKVAGPDRLYVGAYGVGMRIFDISEPENPKLMGAYTPPPRADAVPDATIMQDRGEDRERVYRHIAVLNGTRRLTAPHELRTDRSEFLDVTDPKRPVVLWTFVGQDDGEAHMGKIVDELKWWLPTGGTGNNGLRIYDLRPLMNDDPMKRAPERLWPPRPAAAPCPEEPVDPNNPTGDKVRRCDPVTLWKHSPYRGDDPVGGPFTHSHDITIYPRYMVRQPDGSLQPRTIALMAEGGSYLNDAGNTGSVFVIDITNPRNPVVLQRWLHETGANHQPIRYHHEAQFLDMDRHVMIVTDEDLHSGCGPSGGGAYAIRVPEDLTGKYEELSEWFIPQGTPAPVCSVHVFSSKRNLVFFGSYSAGLQVVDYADPSKPKQVGSYIPVGSNAWGAHFWRGVIYVGEMGPRGLDVYRYTGPTTSTRPARR